MPYDASSDAPALFTLVVDGEGRVCDCDAAATAALNQPREALVGRPLAALIPGAPAAGNEGASFNAQVRIGDSAHLHAQVMLSPLFGGRRMAMVREAKVDVGRLHREFVLSLADRLQAQDAPEAVLDVLLPALGHHLGASRVVFSEMDLAADTSTAVGCWTDGTVPALHGAQPLTPALGPTIVGGYRRGETLVNDDALDDDRTGEVDPRILAHLKVRGVCTVPYLEEGELAGVLSVHTSAPHAWTPAEVQVVEEVAARAREAYRRAQAQARLRDRDRRQAFLLELSEAIRHETEPMAILRVTGERLGRHLEVDRVVYGEIDPASGDIVSPCDWCAPDLVGMAGRRLKPTADNWIIRGYREGRTASAADFAELKGTTENFRALHREIGATGFVTAPLVKEGRLHGLFSVYDRRRREWSPGEVGLVEEVGERTWEALWRARAEASSRASEEQFRTFAESLPDIAFVVDGEGAPLWWNRRHEEALGPGRGMAHVAVMCHPDEREAVMAAWGAAMAAGEPIHAECRLMGVDGRYRLFRAHASPVKDAAGRVVRWAGLVRDVQEARQRERAQAFLLDLGDALRQASGSDALQRLAADRLGAFLDVDLVGFSELQPDGETLRIEQECARAALPSLKGELRMDAFGPSEHMAGLARGAPIAVDDVERELADDPMLAGCRAIGVMATLSLPILVEGRFRAVLYANHGAPREWTPADLELVREVAERTWATVERARAEEAQKGSEALLSAIMTNAPIGMYLKDEAGRYVLANPEMSRLIGRPLEEIIGRTVADLLPPKLARIVERADAEVLEHRRLQSVEAHLPGREAYEYAMVMRFPVQAGPDAPLRVAGFDIDISDRRRTQAELERSREALYQSEKLTALGSLLAGVSHELNNPLSIVVAQAVMMERQAGADSPLTERARKIRNAADRCARIVQTFLAMARQRKPERRRVDLNAVVDAALELTAYGLRTNGVRLVRDQAAALPPIAADADQLHQVIINLVINAQQAMQERAGERELRVRTLAAPGGDEVWLEVADSGPGVPADLRRRIFEPFFTTKPQEVGTGVGLSFSQGLVEAHGGRLELLPDTRGATFRVALPIAAVEAMAPAPAAPVPAVGGAPTRRALVIDDEPEIAGALAEFLSFEGFESDVAFGGAEAKARLARGAYDLIVSDLRMPDIDGPALYAWIEAERPDLARRVAFATGDTLGADAVRFLAREGRPFMEKPFTPESLRALLDDVEACA